MNAQDEMYAKMAHLSSKKQEGLREEIATNICCSTQIDGSKAKEIADSILQQVIEWIDTEIIGEDEWTGTSHHSIESWWRGRQSVRKEQRQKLSQLKEDNA